ncbi:MAG: bifunctional phosphoribosyl-AMP cyclohydrolase/phosphoribosyl-ATP diphosphatase HisIE [Armatimonadota bacterium]|nr:bifunctional phosphoribosyl-AMP cyclohydrolase/phosphoribosyl-ATP diphosphatase HisIE [Armatimonadota bacterium]MDR7440032.1 bifunctional phosphoribosyl-AMP cyclohydrolase/phosphoribosyl-ATP diphosphatase HisIE [Armatimonadota bacterium]MDR7562497.1 bifunctional phosphoribosyl-AMP cyclohydrolase/phosphoribosyl-ATP diphosphatase HisIE [Armatimonadota bacterium]MDR7566804.1 bifunctional phosphoribosyl-AMP cyclohydrolase/phosphoribosyl-ATP diphosphatase HisIE [Armatimonadota bacterium]MDR760138
MKPRTLVYDDRGLVPVVVQDRRTGEVLMLAYANAEAVERTRATGFAHFWSRSRNALWMKGETSGNRLRVSQILVDCDTDALLYVVEPEGPTCHLGERTCFHRDLEGERASSPAGILSDLAALIAHRAAHPVEGSYTSDLLRDHPARLREKVYEEAAEVARAAREEGRERLAEEAADLLYHLLVLLQRSGAAWEEVLDRLIRRRTRGARPGS